MAGFPQYGASAGIPDRTFPNGASAQSLNPTSASPGQQWRLLASIKNGVGGRIVSPGMVLFSIERGYCMFCRWRKLRKLSNAEELPLQGAK